MAGRNFSKSYSSPLELIKLLKSRGLEIDDERRAQHYLENVGYYRLSAYMFPFLTHPKSLHQYKKGASFGKVIRLYTFDKKLRMLVLNEIEKIEVSVREAIMNITAQVSGDIFWLMNSSHFANKKTFEDTVNLITKEYRKSTEDFIQHFKRTYSDPYPPAWILGELLTMGTVNIIYRNLKDDKIRKAVSSRYGLQPKVFESWLTTLTLLRNACCHHSRVWNKINFILPMMPKRINGDWITLQIDQRRTYFNLCIIKYFLTTVSPHNDLSEKLKLLFMEYPEIDLLAMGFPAKWDSEPLWHPQDVNSNRYAALSDPDKTAYRKSLKAYRDAYSIAETERSIGKEEGMQIGEARGRRAEKLSSARKMKEAGLRIDMISDFTGLTEAEIQTL